MKKLRVIFKRAIIIIFAASLIGFIAIELIDSSFNRYASGTQVGDIYIGGMEKNSARTEVNIQSQIYLSEVRFSWTLYNQTEDIDLDFASINTPETFNLISNGRKSFLVFDFTDDSLEDQIGSRIDPSISAAIDYELLETDIKTQLTFMSPGSSYNLLDYITDFSGLEIVLNSATVEGENVEQILYLLGEKDMVIEPLSRFAILDYIETIYMTEQTGSEIGTAINSLVVNSPFVNIIKTNQRDLEDYSDEEVLKLNTLINVTQDIDYSFYNPLDQTYKIKVIDHGDSVEFQLLGIPFHEEYVNEVEIIELTEEIEGEEVVTAIFVEVHRYKQREDFLVYDRHLYTNYYGNIDDTYEG